MFAEVGGVGVVTAELTQGVNRPPACNISNTTAEVENTFWMTARCVN